MIALPKILITCTTAAMIGSAQAASIYSLLPKMQDDVACMARLLNGVRGVDRVKVGAFEREGWVYPYLEYRAATGPNGAKSIVRYEAGQGCNFEPSSDGTEEFRCTPYRGPYLFTTDLPDPDRNGADDAMARLIQNRWLAQCGVHAYRVPVIRIEAETVDMPVSAEAH